MDLHYKQEITVGALVIVAAAILITGLMWLTGRSLWSADLIVRVRFADVSGLRVGDPVQLSGVKVGRVSNVVVEDVGRVMVYLEISRRYPPHTDAKALVTALDFFGAKFVDYVPGNAPELLKPDQEISGGLKQAFTETAADLGDRASEVLLGVQGIVTSRTADDIHNTMVAAQRALNVMSRVGEGPTVSEAREALGSLNRLATRLDSTLGNPAVAKSVQQLDEIAQNINEMTEGLALVTKSLGSILAKMDSSKGTFGRMVNDTTLYADLHELAVSLKKLLDDIRERPGRYINVKVF